MYTRTWTSDRIRYRLDVRFAWPSWGTLRYQCRQWLAARKVWMSRCWLSLDCRTRPRQHHECYCPHGSSTEFGIYAFGLLFSAELSRAWVRYPCHCVKVGWLLCPEDHREEIEDYGWDRLQAEYPGLAAGEVLT